MHIRDKSEPKISRPVSSKPLREKHDLYFDLSAPERRLGQPFREVVMIPVTSIRPAHDRPNWGRLCMEQTAEGERDKRGPITVIRAPYGKASYAIDDGNSTLNEARRARWKYIPAIVVR